METSKAGIELIKKYEGLRLQAYRCPAGELTIGYGHTGQDVKPGMTINKEMAEWLLKEDLKVREKNINELVKVTLRQNQFNALVSFVYNVGVRNFETSTLLKLINQNKMEEAAEEFMKWTKVRQPGGLKEFPGLVKRRAEEKELFIKKD